jgi:hypothetical protein
MQILADIYDSEEREMKLKRRRGEKITTRVCRAMLKYLLTAICRPREMLVTLFLCSWPLPAVPQLHCLLSLYLISRTSLSVAALRPATTLKACIREVKRTYILYTVSGWRH